MTNMGLFLLMFSSDMAIEMGAVGVDSFTLWTAVFLGLLLHLLSAEH